MMNLRRSNDEDSEVHPPKASQKQCDMMNIGSSKTRSARKSTVITRPQFPFDFKEVVKNGSSNIRYHQS